MKHASCVDKVDMKESAQRRAPERTRLDASRLRLMTSTDCSTP